MPASINFRRQMDLIEKDRKNNVDETSCWFDKFESNHFSSSSCTDPDYKALRSGPYAYLKLKRFISVARNKMTMNMSSRPNYELKRLY